MLTVVLKSMVENLTMMRRDKEMDSGLATINPRSKWMGSTSLDTVHCHGKCNRKQYRTNRVLLKIIVRTVNVRTQTGFPIQQCSNKAIPGTQTDTETTSTCRAMLSVAELEFMLNGNISDTHMVTIVNVEAERVISFRKHERDGLINS